MTTSPGSASAAPAALIFSGRVMHARHVAPRHHFAYRIWMLAIDLDRIDEVAAGWRGFAHNRFAALALHDRDHGPRDGSALRDWVAGRLAEAGLARFAARIHFVVVPRLLGYAFNPIACYFCHDAQGRLGAILHQVKNTFGHQHTYLLPVEPVAPNNGAELLHHDAAKRLHVSPFFDRAGGYHFACRAPDFSRSDGALTLSIGYGTAVERRMTAVLRLRARPLTPAGVLRVLAGMPLAPLKIIAAIHWQALRLWLRGARYHPVPAAPEQPTSQGLNG